MILRDEFQSERVREKKRESFTFPFPYVNFTKLTE